MAVAELALWTLIAVVIWVYAGYPALLAVVARARPRALLRAPIEPTVTVIIAAHNEERDIARTLETALALEYPRQKLEVVVASDCSTDGTHAIVAGFAERGVRLAALPERGGKTAAQNAGARVARGEILVFTDATTSFSPDMLRALVPGFADARVGCVGAALEYRSERGTAVGRGGGLYWRYEKRVKALESAANSLIGVSGCLYAVRARLFTDIEPDLISDFTTVLDVFAKGYLTIYGQGSVSREKTNEDARREFEMRTRVAIRSFHALARRAWMLNPFRYGLFAVQLWSHKLLRYLVAEMLAAALVITALLALSPGARVDLYQALLALQLGGYSMMGLFLLAVRLGVKARAVSAPVYFAQANAAAVWALIQYLRGERKVTWTTAR